ncbi:Phage-related protein, tail component [Luteibacter sp. UNC138MFCol5.1]|uniref:host specificity protein J n=1 Tax=Luteibacter sp. UNC138MFCol5.1 TaxID=1502774 RepID=UPI0008BC48DD|nr:phage tail protein [Luteibacter sp. UNC138MFCol5.1]SEO63194.1 Phage-related protein, tail component [Luteibacter sp. UNC138MFCol5.1]
MGLDLILGAKGGGSTHTPVEAPDTLRSISYFQIEDLLSEGEIGGLVNGLQSVLLDGTPVANADGTLNFSGVSVQIRTGTQDQSYIPGYGSVKNEIAVSTELKSDTPWVRALNNLALSAFAVTLQADSLQKSNTKNGDINGYMVQYAIDVSTDGGAYQTVLTTAFNGKASGPYQRTHRVDLPRATLGWNVRVRRLTPNANSATTADTTRVVSITEIVDAKLRYPNTAYVAISGDASQFSNIPVRSYVCWGRTIRIPTNYDPATRSYNGVWDGSFKIGWTDNPAWILYDLVVNDRYGIGDLVDASLINKWELYRIAQYCDQLVPDGQGGQEPRYRCTAYLQSREDAFRLLGDVASVFSGVSYWMGSAITTVADMPQDPVYTYTAANVIDGRFTYQSSARKTRFSTAQVTWNDPSNNFKQRVEYVPDNDAIARYGVQPTEFVAFGTTSQGQAHRRGLWALTTSQYETDSVTFAVGLEGLRAAPGQIIRVQDPKRAGMRQAGRLSDAAAGWVLVDREPGQVAVGDTLTVHLPNGTAQTRTISQIDGRKLYVGQGFTDVPVPQSVWTVESDELVNQTFRILSVSEDSGQGEIRFTITAVQHNASKFAHIDSGATIQIPPISTLPTGAQKPPTNVRVSGHVVVEQGIANNVMTIEWDAAESAVTYKVEWQKDNGQWIQAGTVPTTSVDIVGVYTGTYIARVTAFNVGRTPSIAALSAATPITGKTGEPPRLTTLTTTSLPFGIGLDWTFPPNATDTQRTEIWASETPVRPDAQDTVAYHLGDYAYPGNHTELHGLSGGASLFFWGRIVDKAGNVGGWYPESGAVNGQTISDPEDPAMQAYWAGLIGRSALTAQLLADIDAAAAFGEYVNAPEWATGTAYAAGTIVSDGGRLWRAAQAVPAGGAKPGTNPAFWEDIGTVEQTAYGQAAAIHDTTLLVDELDGEVQATASRTDAVYAQVNPKSAGEYTGPGDDAGDWETMPFAGWYTYTVAQVTADRALAQQTEIVQATVAGYSASIEQVSRTTAALDGKVSASYVIKTQVAANGQRYMAGIALGVDYSGGDVTSQVIVNAGTFAVINATDGSIPVTYPFVIQGGQVFISQALIGTGWITNAMIGNQIASTALINGLPVWELNKSGLRVVRGNVHTINEDSTSWRLINNANGVVVVELGDLG